MFRCSICDRQETRFVYNDWHCFPCEDSIRQAVGDLHEEDFQVIILGDEPEGSLTTEPVEYTNDD